MSKQTSVEWLYERLERMIPKTALYNIDKKQYFEQAKAMEREQIIDAVSKGFDNCEEGKVRWLGEEYYNETYKGGEQ